MSTVKHFINEALKRTEISEFLQKELDRAGFGEVEITTTPLGTRVVIYAMRLGIVIGRRGTAIRELAKKLEEKFGLPNPQIAVAEVEFPELNPRIMAARIVDGLQRGIHFRRSGFWSLGKIMGAGALGAEITISGKLRTRRHRYEKYRAGYIPNSGEPAMRNVKIAVRHAKLKPGVLGVKVKIVPPDAKFPDRINIMFPSSGVEEMDNEGSIEEPISKEE